MRRISDVSRNQITGNINVFFDYLTIIEYNERDTFPRRDSSVLRELYVER